MWRLTHQLEFRRREDYDLVAAETEDQEAHALSKER